MRIKAMRRLEQTALPPSGQGDNWVSTWAKDDVVYTGLCDGHGWEALPGYDGTYYNSRLYAIDGEPPCHRFRHLSGYPFLDAKWWGPEREYSRYYGFGILALDECLYQFLSTPSFPFGPEHNAFIGAKLIWSPDLGKTWKNQNGGTLCWEKWEDRSRENMVFFEEPNDCFSLITVLQMGKNYEQNKDGYVYLYAPNGTRDGDMNELVMLRVRKEAILDRNKYEYFAGFSPENTPRWSCAITDRVPTHTFPLGYVNWAIGPGHGGHPYGWHPSVVYNAPLGVYMMSAWGMGVDEGGDWFTKPSYLGIWVAETPWGPWRQVLEEKEWLPRGDRNARAYQPQISPKWISGDGKSFWLIWTDFQEIPNVGQPYYAFNCQKVEIETEP